MTSELPRAYGNVYDQYGGIPVESSCKCLESNETL